MNTRARVHDEAAFLLHIYPYKETSLIAEVWSRTYGRVSVMAKGARRPYSTLRSVLMAFQPLQLGWLGKGELKTLTQAEWQGGQPMLSAGALLCAYYLNELLLRLVQKEDAHPILFDAYAQALGAMMEKGALSGVLRRFEWVLLHELGYGPQLHQTVDAQPVQPDAQYAYIMEHGLVAESAAPAASVRVSGRTALSLAQGDFSTPKTLLEAKTLLRALIDPLLDGKPLLARRVLTEILEL